MSLEGAFWVIISSESSGSIVLSKIPDNQIAFYQSPDGSVNIEVMYAEENIWLTQKKIAELFGVDRSVIIKHLKNIFSEGELEKDSVSAKFAHTAEDGKSYLTKFYSLEAIIAVGYRVNSGRGTEFRQWATGILKSDIHKGYALDSNRMKYGSRFSTRYFDELYFFKYLSKNSTDLWRAISRLLEIL